MFLIEFDCVFPWDMRLIYGDGNYAANSARYAQVHKRRFRNGVRYRDDGVRWRGYNFQSGSGWLHRFLGKDPGVLGGYEDDGDT